jgi:hypothetical protein
MSHKRKPNLHKVRITSYVCGDYTQSACYVSAKCQQVNFIWTGAVFLRAKLTCAESRKQHKLRYRDYVCIFSVHFEAVAVLGQVNMVKSAYLNCK